VLWISQPYVCMVCAIRTKDALGTRVYRRYPSGRSKSHGFPNSKTSLPMAEPFPLNRLALSFVHLRWPSNARVDEFLDPERGVLRLSRPGKCFKTIPYFGGYDCTSARELTSITIKNHPFESCIGRVVPVLSVQPSVTNLALNGLPLDLGLKIFELEQAVEREQWCPDLQELRAPMKLRGTAQMARFESIAMLLSIERGSGSRHLDS
jgi:hypothetical protein